MILTPKQVEGNLRTKTDVVIMGTGAGGSAAAATLAEAGAKVILLEAGRRVLPPELKQKASWAYRNLYQAKGTRVARGNVLMPVMSAEVVGGGTYVNSAICFRAPERVLRRWVNEFGIEFATPENMRPIFEEVEQDIMVQKTTPQQARGNNLIFKKGADALGWEGDFISRNAPGCTGCGVCQFGCPSAGKGSTDTNYLPRATTRGAVIYAEAKVDRVQVAAGRATGVVGHFSDGRPFEIDADHVMLAGGAFGTPLALFRSRLGGSSGHLGRNVHVHPGVGTVAFFPEPINLWDGVTQGYFVADFDNGLILETFSATPDVLFMAFPRGALPAKRMKYMGACGVMIGDESAGNFVPSGDDVDLRYDLVEADRARLVDGLRRVVKAFFAAGALEVHPGISSGRLANTLDGVLEQLPPDLPVSRMSMQSSHPQGSARMAADPKQGVVRPDGQLHGVDNLWVADASLFPSAVSVNPQITIMAFAKVIARNVLTA